MMSDTKEFPFLNIAMIGVAASMDIGAQLIKSIKGGHAGFTLSYYDNRVELSTRETIVAAKILAVAIGDSTVLFTLETINGTISYFSPTSAENFVYFVTGEPYHNDSFTVNHRITSMAKLLQSGAPFYIRDKGTLVEYEVIEIIGVREDGGETASVPAFRLIDMSSGQYIIRCWDASFDMVDCLTPADEADIQLLLEELDEIN